MMAILVFQNNEMAAMLVSKQILKTRARVKFTPSVKGGVIFTRARASLALLSLRKNGVYS